MSDFIVWICNGAIKHIGLREDLIKCSEIDPAKAWELAARYLAADNLTKLDIEAFFEPMKDSDKTGKERMEDLYLNHVCIGDPCGICGKPL